MYVDNLLELFKSRITEIDQALFRLDMAKDGVDEGRIRVVKIQEMIQEEC